MARSCDGEEEEEEEKEEGGGGQRVKEREGRLMSRQLHSGGHQSNTMQPAGCRCLPDGQMPQLRYPLLLKSPPPRTHINTRSVSPTTGGKKNNNKKTPESPSAELNQSMNKNTAESFTAKENRGPIQTQICDCG